MTGQVLFDPLLPLWALGALAALCAPCVGRAEAWGSVRSTKFSAFGVSLSYLRHEEECSMFVHRETWWTHLLFLFPWCRPSRHRRAHLKPASRASEAALSLASATSSGTLQRRESREQALGGRRALVPYLWDEK